MFAVAASTVGALIHGKYLEQPVAPADQALMDSILKEWPVLRGADTLLAMQAVFRVCLLSSAVFRRARADESPFVGLPSMFFLLAALARVLLLWLSPAGTYHLDGPLGGNFDFFFEVAAVPLLVYICRSSIQRIMSLITMVLVACLAAGVAGCNRLALAGNGDLWYVDVLFSLGHVLEFGAAAAFLVRNVIAADVARGTFSGLSLVLLPMQQCLSVYFVLFAFGSPLKSYPELAAMGHPLEMLQLCGVLQVVMYCLAFVVHVVYRTGPRDILRQLTKVEFSEALFNDESPKAFSTTCSICLERFCKDDDISCTCCTSGGHVFHTECLRGWLQTKRTCPLCRFDLVARCAKPESAAGFRLLEQLERN